MSVTDLANLVVHDSHSDAEHPIAPDKSSEVSDSRPRSSCPLKILVFPDLHRTTSSLKRSVKQLFEDLQGIATSYYGNASLLYKRPTDTKEPSSDNAELSDSRTPAQVCVSLKYIDHLFKSAGPFDGLIGFAEGASLAGLLSALQPRENVSFHFVVLFSGFASRVECHKDLFEAKSIKDVCSLHIYGNKDDVVHNDRTIELASAFDDSTVIIHAGSRFTPKTWPNAAFRQFLLEQQTSLSERANTEMITSADLLLTWNEKVEATILLHQKRTRSLPAGERQRMKLSVIPVGLDSYRLADAMLLVWSERTTFFHHWMQLYLKKPDEVLSLYLDAIPKYGGWGDVKTIYFDAQRMKDQFPNERVVLDNLQTACVKLIGNQLQRDYQLVLRQSHLELVQRRSQNWVSQCANEIPTISNDSNDLKTILAKEIAEYLQTSSVGAEHSERQVNVSKGHAYQTYQCLVGTVRRALKKSSLVFLDEHVTWKDRPLFCTRQQREEVLAGPLSSKIIHPQPQPIVPCPLQELQPLLKYLTANKPSPSGDQQPIVFPRGTLMTGGRLDLCKQAVGPLGVQPLLNAMKHSSSVTRLLLGNNIVGRAGAEAISEYIRSNANSTIDTWYIACNRFDSGSISLICDALATDEKVKSLWFKRNPILPDGATHIARMLTSNTHLQTLDLLNTGLLDEGCDILFTSLQVNHTLKHLYIDSNGLTSKSGRVIRSHFEQNDNRLETLYLSCNLLGDEGTREIAEGLKHDRRLVRLSLASNALGVDGVRALVDALIGHRALQELNLGFMKSTTVLGGLNNTIGDEGAAEISRLIQFNSQIRSIDLTRNEISQRGLIQLRDALKANHTLTTLTGLSSKHIHDRTIKKEISTMLRANMIEWGREVLGVKSLVTIDECLKKGQELDHEVNYPEHIIEVISYYRIQ